MGSRKTVRAGDVVRFRYNNKSRKCIIINRRYRGLVHAIDLNSLSDCEKKFLYSVIYPSAIITNTYFLQNIKRKIECKPNAHIKSPTYFYGQYVKPFVRNKLCYKTFNFAKMKRINIVNDEIVFDESKEPIGLYTWLKL